MFLLDTCFLSEFFKKTPDMGVVSWIKDQIEEEQFISVLTFGEIRKGIEKLGKSKRRDELSEWFETVRDRYGDRVLPINAEIADRWGMVKAACEAKGDVLSVIDSLIAATALVHGLTVVTRNLSDFAPSGVKTLNVWTDLS